MFIFFFLHRWIEEMLKRNYIELHKLMKRCLGHNAMTLITVSMSVMLMLMKVVTMRVAKVLTIKQMLGMIIDDYDIENYGSGNWVVVIIVMMMIMTSMIESIVHVWMLTLVILVMLMFR